MLYKFIFFQIMDLYNIALQNVIIKNISYDQLPHTIKTDLDQLKNFKSKLMIAMKLKEQIDEKNCSIDDNTFLLEYYEQGLMWNQSYYDEYEEIENVVERLEREKEDLEMLLGNCESDVITARKDIENSKESNIDCNILLHLEQIYQY